MKVRILLVAILLGIGAIFWRLSQPPRPDPRMVALAARATVYALPTPTPLVVEVTRIVEVTRVVEVTPIPTATLTPTVTATPTPPGEPESSAPPEGAAAVLASAPAEPAPPPAEVAPAPDAGGDAAAAEPAQEASVAPAVAETPPDLAAQCPTTSDRRYTTIPVAGGGLEHADGQHADLNLTLRGYTPVDAPRALFDKDGPVDGDPPQLAGIFADNRAPAFGATYRVFDWNWGCGGGGCRGEPLGHVAVTLVELQTAPGEALGIPHRGAQVYGGGYKAMVLYAEPTQITLGYTREDTVANGYAVHLEDICVDPNLVALYQGSNSSGRGFLPALREDEVLGVAPLGFLRVAVRDRGVFFDPRSRMDWWQGY
jgi:hypothetical protein